MKRINFFATMMTVALCVGFTSCGSDDEDGDGDNTKPNTSQVSKIIYDSGDDEDFLETFQYDAQGRVSQYVLSVKRSEMKCSYAYNDKTIVATVTDKEDGTSYPTYTLTYTLKDGLIVSQRSNDLDCDFAYNANKQLKSVTWINTSGNNDIDLYEWANGNLVSAMGDTYIYTQYKNNVTIDLNAHFMSTDLEEARGLEKYFGALSTNLVDRGGKYEFDKNGLMTKLNISEVTMTVEYYK